MMPVEWPIAVSSADQPVSPARAVGRDRLSAVRADFFLDDRDRLSEQERALMGAMLASLLDQLVDELAVAMPAALADRVELSRPSLLRRLWGSRVLDRPALIGLLLRRSDEQRLSPPQAGGMVESLVGDDDEDVAEAAMALTVARGRRRDRFGRLGIEFDDLLAEEAVSLVNLLAAAIRCGMGAEGPVHDAAIAAAAQAVLVRHDEGNRLDARVSELAFALVDAGRSSDELVASLAESGEVALLSAILSVRAAIEPATGWLMMVEQGSYCAMLLARLAGLDRPFAARLVVAIGGALGIADPAVAIGEFDAIGAAELEAQRRWLRLPRIYRDSIESIGPGADA
jgi:hypothetical protein